MRGITVAPRTRRRQPYNPAQPHDRRAKEINRGQNGYTVEVLIDDPYEPGAKIATVRSVRDDPLADRFSRGHIDQAQFDAGREFQRHFGIAERGPRAVQLSEAVDGDPPRENLTDGQLLAGKWLAKCYRKLGADGSSLVHDMLVHAMSTKQIAESRGMAGQDWERYFGKRLWECLNTLAVVYGFSNGEHKTVRVGTKDLTVQ
jgi:hypothetical protein